MYAAIARRAPDFVLHCGDITRYRAAGRVRAVLARRSRPRCAAGSGTCRATTRCAGIRRPRGSTGSSSAPRRTRSTRAACIVAGFDPTQSLLEPGHCGAAALEWLDRDLAAADGPALLFQHFPVGGEHDYVDDQAALLELVARHGVRVLVAGHVHRETVTRLDGLVQVTLQAVLKEPVFYWAELGDGPALEDQPRHRGRGRDAGRARPWPQCR